jgi:hypothetical protein
VSQLSKALNFKVLSVLSVSGTLIPVFSFLI